MKRIMKYNYIFLIIISTMLLIYFYFFVVPFAETYNFFNENSGPQKDKIPIYMLMTIPIYIGYVIYALVSIYKLHFLRCINYPLTLLSLYIGFFTTILPVGGAILWLAVLTIPPLLLVLISTFIIGVILDVKFFRR